MSTVSRKYIDIPYQKHCFASATVFSMKLQAEQVAITNDCNKTMW